MFQFLFFTELYRQKKSLFLENMFCQKCEKLLRKGKFRLKRCKLEYSQRFDELNLTSSTLSTKIKHPRYNICMY